MFKNKIVTTGLAGMLAMSLGLAACGNNNASTTTTEPAAENTTTAPAATNATANANATADTNATAATERPLYWEGKLADGSDVGYMQSDDEKEALLSITNGDDIENAKVWSGTLGNDTDGMAMITNEETGETIKFSVIDFDEATTTMTIDIEGYGEVDLKGVTEAEFEQQFEAYLTTMLESADMNATVDMNVTE